MGWSADAVKSSFYRLVQTDMWHVRGNPIRGFSVLGPAVAWSAAVWIGGPASADEVVLGPSDSLALDQPRVTFGLTDESTNPATLLGPGLFNSALLDTGANGVLLAAPSYNQGENYGQPAFAFDYDGDGTIEPGEQLAQYAELGVAGTTLLDVHDVHALRIEDSDGVERVVNNNLRAFGDPTLNIGSFGAIVGMPAMEGLAVEIDMRPNATIEAQRVVFHDTIAGALIESPQTMTVGLRILEPEYTDTTFIDAGRPDLLPTFAGLPLIDNMDMRHTGGADSGGATLTADNYTFLVDTGAQTDIISEQMALDLGIDFTQTLAQGGDVVDFLEVGGIGGTVAMPLVSVDAFIMPTQGGADLVWTNNLVGVLDIDGAPFDGVMGMNKLTTGYLGAVFGGFGGGGGTTIVNPLYEDPTAVTLLINAGFITTVDQLFSAGVFDISMEDYQLLVDSQILPDTNDPLVAYNAALDLDAELGAGLGLTTPLFDKVVFDFTATDGTAEMRLDFAGVLALGDLNGDGTLSNADIAGFIMALTDPAGYDALHPNLDRHALGDFDGDGRLTNLDIAGFVDALSLTGTAALIPEPTSLALLGIAGVLLLRRPRTPVR
ncbi:MAG: PEP-CTERM sorting domain-containing protein [Planctomycetota bacterium]